MNFLFPPTECKFQENRDLVYLIPGRAERGLAPSRCPVNISWKNSESRRHSSARRRGLCAQRLGSRALQENHICFLLSLWLRCHKEEGKQRSSNLQVSPAWRTEGGHPDRSSLPGKENSSGFHFFAAVNGFRHHGRKMACLFRQLLPPELSFPLLATKPGQVTPFLPGPAPGRLSHVLCNASTCQGCISSLSSFYLLSFLCFGGREAR